MTTQTRRLTYEEYLKGPEIKRRYDIVDGEMIMAPAPTLEHQRILRRLVLILAPFVDEHRLGEVLFAPVDVLIQREPLRTRQPDLIFIGKERAGMPGQVVEGPLDLVVEVLSSSNTRRDVEDKITDYARIGVKECWLVSPEARTVEVLMLVDGAWQRAHLYGLGDTIHSDVLEGFGAEVYQLFGQGPSSSRP